MYRVVNSHVRLPIWGLNANPFLSGDCGEYADDRLPEDAERIDILLGVALELHARVGEAAQVRKGFVRALAGEPV